MTLPVRPVEAPNVLTRVATNGGEALARFGSLWSAQIAELRRVFGDEIVRVFYPDLDPVDLPVIEVRPGALIRFLIYLRNRTELAYEFLSDLTALDDGPGEPRFTLVYNLLSPKNFARIRIQARARSGERFPSGVGLWPGANWAEREIFDMYGIQFEGHPDLRRILLQPGFVGHPLLKDYAHNAFQIFPESDPIHPELLGLAPRSDDSEGLFADNPTFVNFGPSHPAMHGSFRAVLRLSGEKIEKSYCEFGFTHRAKEKLGETKTYHQWIVFSDRLNYCSTLANNTAYAMAVERLMGIYVPERLVWLRMICTELARVVDHLVCIGANAVDLGAFSSFLYGFHQREEAYTLIEGLCGARMTTSYFRIGGVWQDAPPGFEKEVIVWARRTLKVVNEMDRLLSGNRIWRKRTVGIGALTRAQCIDYSITGPLARASGLDIDLRRDQPSLFYDQVEFDVPRATEGDVFARYVIRIEEIRQSLGIIIQCAERMRPGPVWSEDKRVRIPDKEAVYNTMESMIDHFMFFMDGFHVPEGEAYTQLEAPNGELGFYIVSRGGPRAHRLRVRGPSFWHYQALPTMVEGEMVADFVAAFGSINVIAGEIDR